MCVNEKESWVRAFTFLAIQGFTPKPTTLPEIIASNGAIIRRGDIIYF